MLISDALSIAKDIAKKIAMKLAQRYAEENLSHGPAALNAIEKDLYRLAEKIYSYQASFQGAKVALSLKRSSNADYIQHCVKALPLSEAEGILQLRNELREIGRVAIDLEAQAIARARSQEVMARKEMDRWAKNLSRAEKTNSNPQIQWQMARMMRGAANDLANYQRNIRTIDLKSDAIEVLMAGLIGSLVNIRQQLISNQSSFAYFAKDCAAWRLVRIEQGVY